MSKRIRVAVLYGGRSGEHEVSLRSAASVVRYLDSSRFEVTLIGIEKGGTWRLASQDILQDVIQSKKETLPLLPTFTEYHPSCFPGSFDFDVVFPVLHGTFCEDGTLQGLFELAEVAYVGCGVLSSSVGMDKDFSKRLAQLSGVPVAPYFSFHLGEWQKNKASVLKKAQDEMGYPCFVKPANSGSSVGIHKVKTENDLAEAIENAFMYDTKILIETSVNAREIELSVLEDWDYGAGPRVSVCGEVTPSHEFYSYEAKYLDEKGASLMIPAPLTPEQVQQAQDLARKVFTALGCEGLARVDLFLDKKTNQFWFNEINTLPGFTSISMYPKMWEASGLKYSDLLTHLIDLALQRHQRKKKLLREWVR